MIMKLLSCIFYPIRWLMTRRARRDYEEAHVTSGIYIIRYSSSMVKIGMSSDIKRRLKQYKGY